MSSSPQSKPRARKKAQPVKLADRLSAPKPAPKPRKTPFVDPAKASEAGKKGAAGRPQGAKSLISEAKHKFLALSGQTPLEFLTAVYRDQLYSEYEVEVVDEKKGLARVWPKLHPVTGELDCTKIPVELEKRIAAATAAAPYVHRKKPIGIDGGEGKALTFISADQLAKLDDKELSQLLEIMGRLGIGAEFAGGERDAPTLED